MIRVLVADDRPGGLSTALGGDPQLAVVAETGVRGLCASVRAASPDVVAVGLDGNRDVPAVCREIEEVMAGYPCPILALYRSGGDDTWGAVLRAGAVAALPADEDVTAVRRRLRILSGVPVVTRRPAQRPRAAAPHTTGPTAARIVALVASTGGPPALARVLADLGAAPAPVLVVQHIDAGFTEGFATWLGRAAHRPCVLAEAGQRPQPGTIYVAPPSTHLRLGPGFKLELDSEPKTLHRPSGDILLHSVATHAGRRAVGAVLTGMGEDGARGLLAMRHAGGRTFAQDETTSAVYGMPRAAARLGAAEAVVALEDLGRAIAGHVATRAVA